MASIGIIELLEELYGEALVEGNEAAFYEFTADKAAMIFDRYAALTASEDLSYTRNTLQKTNFLLTRWITPWMSRAAGGPGGVHDKENPAGDPLASFRPPLERLPGERLVAFVRRRAALGWRDAPPGFDPDAITEEAVLARRTDNLKTLLLIAPSVTIPDQVWQLSVERRGFPDHDAPDADTRRYDRRWRAYIQFLASVRPLIEQGAIRITSYSRMQSSARYNDTSFTPDEDLELEMNKRFLGSSHQYPIGQTIKYCQSLIQYQATAFYENEGNIAVHKAIAEARLGSLNKDLGAAYTAAPAIFSDHLMQAAQRLSVRDLAEVRLNERHLRAWFSCYEEAIAAQELEEFDDRIREGREKLAHLSPTIFDRSKTFVFAMGKSILPKVAISHTIALLGLPEFVAVPTAYAIGRFIAPFVDELFANAPDNALETRAREALEAHFSAFLSSDD